MKSPNAYGLTCFWLISVLMMICGQISATKRYDLLENRMKRQILGGQIFGGQQCVSNEGRPGVCQANACPNLGDKKAVMCNSFLFQTKCCPTSNKGLVLPPKPSVGKKQ